MNHLSLRIQIQFKTPFHITGDRVRWGVDKASAVSADGNYIIPASTVKGLLRAAAGELLGTWNVPICEGPEPGSMCRDTGQLCLLCQIFGNPRHSARLRFIDAFPSHQASVAGLVRSGVSISRQRRASLHQRLYTLETTAASLPVWETRAEGYFETPLQAQQAAAVVLLASRFSPIVGGGRTRGLGWVERWTIASALDGQEIDIESFQSIWESWVQGRDL